jgi:hypothetical protein
MIVRRLGPRADALGPVRPDLSIARVLFVR